MASGIKTREDFETELRNARKTNDWGRAGEMLSEMWENVKNARDEAAKDVHRKIWGVRKGDDAGTRLVEIRNSMNRLAEIMGYPADFFTRSEPDGKPDLPKGGSGE